MCGLPLFPPKPKHEIQTLTRRTSDGDGETDARGSNGIPNEAHPDRPFERGEPLFEVCRPHARSGGGEPQ